MPRASFAASLAVAVVMGAVPPAQAQQAIPAGGVLTGELNAMRMRDATGKRVNTFQLVSEPRRLPGPNGLCNLETGPETFTIVTTSQAEVRQLKPFLGKKVSVRAQEIACAQQAGQWSDAVVSKWSLVTSH